MFVIRERLYAHPVYWVSTTIGTTTCFDHVDTDRTITSKVKKGERDTVDGHCDLCEDAEEL